MSETENSNTGILVPAPEQSLIICKREGSEEQEELPKTLKLPNNTPVKQERDETLSELKLGEVVDKHETEDYSNEEQLGSHHCEIPASNDMFKGEEVTFFKTEDNETLDFKTIKSQFEEEVETEMHSLDVEGSITIKEDSEVDFGLLENEAMPLSVGENKINKLLLPLVAVTTEQYGTICKEEPEYGNQMWPVELINSTSKCINEVAIKKESAKILVDLVPKILSTNLDQVNLKSEQKPHYKSTVLNAVNATGSRNSLQKECIPKNKTACKNCGMQIEDLESLSCDCNDGWLSFPDDNINAVLQGLAARVKSVDQIEPSKMSMPLDASCMIVKKETPDEMEEHSKALNDNIFIKVPVEDEKQEVLVQLVPTDIVCVKHEQIDSCNDIKPNKVSSDQLTQSFEVNDNFETSQRMTFLQKVCSWETANDDTQNKLCAVKLKREVDFTEHSCDVSMRDGSSSTCDKSIMDLQKIFTQQEATITGPKVVACNGEFKYKEINTDSGGKLNGQLVKSKDITKQLKKVKRCDLIHDDNVYLKDEIKSECLETHCKDIPLNSLTDKTGKMLCPKSVFYKICAGEKEFLPNTSFKRFSNSLSYLQQKRSRSIEKLFTCDVCKKRFYSTSHLTCHMRTHTYEKPFTCNVCKTSFSKCSNLLTHKRTHTNEKPFTCDLCNKSFSRSSSLATHKRTHLNEKLFTCNACNKSFSQSLSLLTHKRTHTNEKPFACDVCNKSFSQSSNLGTHKRTHTNEKPFTCVVCNKSFARLQTLRCHKGTHTNEKPFTCDVCGKSYSNLSPLIYHKRSHSNERPFTCNVCNKSFSQSSSLLKHKRTHTNEKPFTCDVCGKSFSQSWNLATHKRTHTNEKPFTCDVCNKSFSRSSHLGTHKRTHSNEKPFTCNVCNKSFSQSSNLATHKRTHTNEIPFTCDVCGKSFSDLSSLRYHKRTHTNEKPFTCNVCKTSFSKCSNLLTHKRTHTNEKPFTCNVCNKSFSQSSSLLKHKRTHTNEKPFTCDVCGKSFSQSSNLGTHKRTHTNEKQFSCDVCNKHFTSKQNLKGHMYLHFQY